MACVTRLAACRSCLRPDGDKQRGKQMAQNADNHPEPAGGVRAECLLRENAWMHKKREDEQRQMIRSTATEYLTFITASGQGGVVAVYADEDVWLSQKMMAGLYDVDVRTINYHLKKCFFDSELQEAAVIRDFRITAADGKSYSTKHYNLSAIISVGYKVNAVLAEWRKG
jgi:hypothetical protein